MATIKLKDYLLSLSSKGSSANNDKITILDSADGNKIKSILKSDLVDLTYIVEELRDDFLDTLGDNVISSSAQVNADTITNFDTNVKAKINSDGVLSGSSQVTLGGFDTDNLSEGSSNLYYTNVRVKTKLNAESVISSSAQIDGEFLNTNGDDVVSSSIQITITDTTGFTTLSSSLQSTDNAIAARVTAVESFSSSLDSTYASDSELTAVSSAFDSTINSLNTADVSEDSSNKYYTDVRVKTKLTAEDVVSGSNSQVKTFLGISASDISDVEAFSQSGTYSGLRAQSTTAADVDLGNVTNESKATMFTSPTFTTNPTAPTQTGTDDSTKLATTEFVQARITDIIGNAGSTLDTLGELSASLAEDSGSLSTLTTTVGTKLAKASNLSDLQDASTARTNLSLGNVTNESKATMFTSPTFTGTVGGTTDFGGNISITGSLNVKGDIMPSAENLYDIGSAAMRWEDMWADQVYGRSVYADDYIYHNGDTDTYIQFQADRQTYVAGTAEFIDFKEATESYITLGNANDTDTRMQGGAGYIFIQGSNGYIGINDATPSYPLEVNANTYIGGTLDISGALTGSGIEITGVSNYNGLTIKAGGASRPGINFENVTQGQLGGIYGTEANSLGLSTQGGIEYVIRNANGASGDHLFKSYNTTILKLDGATNESVFGGNVSLTGSLSISADGLNPVTFTESGNGLLTIATPDDITLDAAGDIIIDAGGDDIRLKVNGTEYGKFDNASSNLNITSIIQDKDIKFHGNDGGTGITALILDMSNGGSATFRDDIDFGGKITQTGTGANKFHGKIGIGITPTTLLHITGSGDAIRVESTNTGAGGAQMDLLHFSPSPDDGDVHGVINMGGYYDGTETSIYGSSIKSTWTDASARNAHLSFHTVSGGTMAERLRISNSGELLKGGIVNAAGQGTLEDFNSTEIGNGYINLCRDDTATIKQIRFGKDGTEVGSISTTNNATAFNESSDYRLKEDLQDFAGLDMVSNIPVYDFKWKSDGSRSYGVMAHELQEVLPHAVIGEKDAEEMQGVDYSKIVPLLVKSIQEQQTLIESQKSLIDNLISRIETLER